MKYFSLGLFFFSSLAFACPDISGTYSCKSTTAVSNKEVIKTDYGFQINSDGNVFNYLTDGLEYSIPSTEDYKDAKVQSYCQNDQFIVNFNATILYQGSAIAKQVSKTSYFMKDDQLVIQQKVKMKNLPMPMVFFTCTKI